MKTLSMTIALSAMVAMNAYGDPAIQIVGGGHVCQIPLSATSPAEEATVSDCKALILEQDGEAGGLCRCEYKDVPKQALQLLEPNDAEYQNGQIILKVKTNYQTLQTPCHLDADGEEYASTYWKSVVAYNLTTMDLVMDLRCGKGQPL